MILELGNGIGHLFFALSHGGYFPGAITALPLLILSVLLGLRLIRFQTSGATGP